MLGAQMESGVRRGHLHPQLSEGPTRQRRGVDSGNPPTSSGPWDPAQVVFHKVQGQLGGPSGPGSLGRRRPRGCPRWVDSGSATWVRFRIKWRDIIEECSMASE
jgi:hypothetical protein